MATIMPAKGNALTLRTSLSATDKLMDFSEQDKERAGLKPKPNGGVEWKDTDITWDIEFSDAERGMIAGLLQGLESSQDLELPLLTAYEKFCESSSLPPEDLACCNDADGCDPAGDA